MTVKEFADQTYYEVKSARSGSEVESILNSAIQRLKPDQIETFIDWYLNGPKMINESQENTITLNNLAKARAILQAKKGAK